MVSLRRRIDQFSSVSSFSPNSRGGWRQNQARRCGPPWGLCGVLHGLAVNRDADARDCSAIERRRVGVDRRIPDPPRRRTQYLGSHLGQRSHQPLPHFHRPALQHDVAARRDFHARLRAPGLAGRRRIFKADGKTDTTIGTGAVLTIADFFRDQLKPPLRSNRCRLRLRPEPALHRAAADFSSACRTDRYR